MEPILETDRLVIRRLSEADVDEAMLSAWLAQYERWPGYGTFAAIERSRGAFIGWLHLRPDGGDDDEPELGYRLRRHAMSLATSNTPSRRPSGRWIAKASNDEDGQPRFA